MSAFIAAICSAWACCLYNIARARRRSRLASPDSKSSESTASQNSLLRWRLRSGRGMNTARKKCFSPSRAPIPPRKSTITAMEASCRTSCGRCCSPTLRAALSIVGVPCPPEGGRYKIRRAVMPRKLNRRELMRAGANACVAAAAFGPAMAMLAAQNTNPTPQVEGVDMSHECTVADPEHYRLEFENEYVRVIRCRIPGRDKVKMHNHPFGSVVIFMTDQNLHQTLENGTTEEAHNRAGYVLWGNDSQARHMGENVTDQLYEYLRVDIKAALPRRA